MTTPLRTARAGRPHPRELLRLSAAAFVLAACTVEQPAPDEEPTEDLPPTAPHTEPAPEDTIRAISFICSDLFRFTLVPEGESGTLFLPDTTLVLERTASATGMRYARAGVELWFDAAEARLDAPGASHTGCSVREGADPWTAARLRGSTFRAVGQEPGWYLEIEQDRITFVGDYGDRTIVTPPVTPARQGDRMVWHARADDHDLRITAEPRACADGMSGERFRYTVEVVADGTTYRGCGRRLD